MSFMYNSTTVANAELRGVSIRDGLGHYVLALSVRFTTPGNADGAVYWLTNVHAKVYAAVPEKSPVLLGYAQTDLPIAIRAGKYPQPLDHSFEVRLSPQELQALEDVRNGAEVKLPFSGLHDDILNLAASFAKINHFYMAKDQIGSLSVDPHPGLKHQGTSGRFICLEIKRHCPRLDIGNGQCCLVTPH